MIPRKLAFPNSQNSLTRGLPYLVTEKPQMSLLLLKQTHKLAISKFAVPKNLSPKNRELGGITVVGNFQEAVNVT